MSIYLVPVYLHVEADSPMEATDMAMEEIAWLHAYSNFLYGASSIPDMGTIVEDIELPESEGGLID